MRKTYTVTTLLPNQYKLEARVLAAHAPDWSLVVFEHGEWRIQRYLTEQEYANEKNSPLESGQRFIRNSWYLN